MTDINRDSLDSDPRGVTNVGGVLFFSANDGVHGYELYRSDGTAAGTSLVKDIVPGAGSSLPTGIVAVGNTAYFVADDGVHGQELWKSDGTEAGTVMVKDLYTAGGPIPLAGARSLVNVGGTLFFLGNDGVRGYELYKSDGTAEGTIQVLDVRPGRSDSDIRDLTVVGDTLYFTAEDGEHGRELWKSDGTAAGTVLVEDLVAGPGRSDPGNLVNVGGTLYFRASDGTHGEELYRSDGTAAGTVLVADVRPGAQGSSPRELVAVGDTLFFTARKNDRELWKSDGTDAGTVLVKDVNADSIASSRPQMLTAVGDTLFFVADDGQTGLELWKSDGTRAGTVLVEDLVPGAGGDVAPTNLKRIGDTLYFTVDDGVHGREVWTSDGTAAGTALLADLMPGPRTSFPPPFFGTTDPGFTDVGGRAFFVASGPRYGKELWTSDGTAAGTVVVADVNVRTTGSTPLGAVAVGDGTVYFSAENGTHGRELWRTDGSAAGTGLVLDLSAGGGPGSFTPVGGTLFFTAADGIHGPELWKTDGTAAGTALVKDVMPGSDAFRSPYYLTAVGATLYFVADDGVHGLELWKSDGTADGTVMVKDLSPDGSSRPHNLFAHNGALYFVAGRGPYGETDIELYRTDGTAEGTVRVKDVNPGPASAFDVYFNPSFASVGDTLYFVAADGEHGRELWKTDGTEAGTALVKEVAAPGTAPDWLTPMGGLLYFTADNGDRGAELWVTDGTAAGTRMVRDVVPGGRGSEPAELTVVGDTLFFRASAGGVSHDGDLELFKSDGTADGTVLVRDIRPGANGSTPEVLTAFEGALYFAADDGVFGKELWRSDGTADGTVLIADVKPGARGGFDSLIGGARFAAAGGRLLFGADDGVHGPELWSYVPAGGLARGESFATAEDTSLAGSGLLDNDTFAPGATPRVLLVAGPAHGTLTLNEDGSFTYTPAADYYGPDTFVYKVDDGLGESNLATVRLTVTPVNDAPRARDDTFRVTPGVTPTAAVPGVLGNDADPEHDPFTAVLVSGPAHGTLTFNEDGSFTYVAGAGFTGTDSFTYRAADGSAAGNLATVTLAANERAVARDDAYVLWQDENFQVGGTGLLGNDGDGDGDALTAVLVTGPEHGYVWINSDGTFNYVPEFGYHGTDRFTYAANDGAANSLPATVTLTVRPLPVAEHDGYLVRRGETLTVAGPGVLANDHDPAGGTLTAVLEFGPSAGSLTLNPDGSFVYTPEPDFQGEDYFVYVAGNGSAQSYRAHVTIGVVPPPEPAPDLYGEVSPASTLTVPAEKGVLANDVDFLGFDLTPAVADGPDHGTLTLAADGSFTYVAAADFPGNDSFTYTVSNGLWVSDPVRVALTSSVIVALDPYYDFFGDRVLTVQAYGGPSRPTFGFFDTGSAVVSFSAFDQAQFAAQGSAIPILLPGGATAGGLGGTVVGHLSEAGAVFVDGVHAAIGTGPDGFPEVQFGFSAGAVVSVPLQTFVGTEGGSPFVPTITGTPVLAPSASNPDGLAAWIDMKSFYLDYTGLFPDLEGFGLEVEPLYLPDLHFVAPGTTLQPVEGRTAPVTVPLTLVGVDNLASPGDHLSQGPVPVQTGVGVSRGELARAGQSFLFDTGAQLSTISRALARELGLDLEQADFYFPVQGVAGEEERPGFVLDRLSLPTADGHTLDFHHVTVVVSNLAPGLDGVLGMNVFNTAGTILYDPYGPSGPSVTFDFFKEPIRYGGGIIVTPVDLLDTLGYAFVGALTGPALPGLTVTGVNRAPTATADAYNVQQGTALTAEGPGVLGNDRDRDGDRLTAVLGTGPAHGSLTFNRDGSFVYTPDAGYTGPDSFTYRATDGVRRSAETTVRLTVGTFADVEVLSVRAEGDKVRVEYRVSNADAAPFTLGFYRSADGDFDRGDARLSAVTIAAAEDLTEGVKVKEFTIGRGAGQVRLPGAGAKAGKGGYQVLAVADVRDAVAEPDGHPFNDNNTAALAGVYQGRTGRGRPAGPRSTVFVHGGESADEVRVEETEAGLVVTVNGEAHRYDLSGVRELHFRGHGGADVFTAEGVSVPVRLWGGAGNDLLTGGAGADELHGNGGSDELVGGPGADWLRGGRGIDRFDGETEAVDRFFASVGRRPRGRSAR